MAGEPENKASGQPPAEAIDPMQVMAAMMPSGAESRPSSFPPSPPFTAEMWSFQARFSSVPMPDHEGLRHLQAIYPKAAEVIFGQMVAQSNHRMDLEREVTKTNNKLALRGQLIAGAVALVGLLGCFVITSHGYPTAGTTIGTALVVTLAYLFVFGKDSKQKKELADKAATRDMIAKGEPPENLETRKDEPAKAGRAKASPKSKK